MYSIITDLERMSRTFPDIWSAVSYAEQNMPANADWEVRNEDDLVVYTHYATVTNSYGVEIDFEAAVYLMDDDLREEIAAEGIDCNQDFFDTYCEAHEAKFGEPWELDKPNPVF